MFMFGMFPTLGGHYHEASLRAQISCAPKSQSLRSRRSAKAALEFSSNRGLPLRVNQVNRPDGQKIGRELVEQRFSFAIALEHTGILAVNANGENSVGRKTAGDHREPIEMPASASCAHSLSFARGLQ